MLNKKLMILAIFFVSLFVVSVVSAADNATEDIVSVEETNDEVVSISDNDVNNMVISNESNDVLAVEYQEDIGATEENELSATAGTFTDLANDISNAGDELNLTRDYIYSSKDSSYNEGITINKKITINGNGLTINGKNQACAFKVLYNNIILKNIVFMNCSVSSSSNYVQGGAVYWSGNNGSLVNSSFVNCFTKSSRGESYSYGGAVYWSGNNGSLVNSSFVNCFTKSISSYSSDYASSASHSYSCGGAVYWSGNNGSLVNSSFVNCLTNSTCTAIKCYSFSYGGGVYWKGVNGTLVNSSFVNCLSYGCSYLYYIIREKDGIYSSGQSSSRSGGVYWTGGNGTLLNSSFKNCLSRLYNYKITHYESSNTNTYNYALQSSTEANAIYWSGNYGYMMNYTVDSNDKQVSVVSKLRVPVESKITANISNIIYGKKVILKPFIDTGAPGTLSIYVDDIFEKTINVGETLDLSKLKVGKHNFTICYNGNSNFKSVEYTGIFWIFTRYPIEIENSKIIYGKNERFKATFYNFNGTVLSDTPILFIVNGSEEVVFTNSEGVAILDVDLAIGEYDVTVVSIFDERVTTKLLIFHSVQAENMIIDYGNSTKFRATFLDENAIPLSNTNIVFNVDGVNKIVKTDINGIAILNQELTIGTHIITSINPMTKINTTNQVVVVSDINSIINVQNINDVNYGQIPILTINVNQDFLNATVEVKITGDNNYSLIFIQNASTKITKQLTGLNAGNYTMVVKYLINNYLVVLNLTKTFKVLKINPKMNIDVEAYSGYAIITTNIPQVSGNVTIKVGNKKTYTEFIPVDGVIKKRIIDLSIGEYLVVVTYNGNDNFNPITKTATLVINDNLSTIEAENMMIEYGNGYDFIATFFDDKGLPLANKYVAFKVNDVEYPVKTDSEGVAKLVIGLNPGEYDITSINDYVGVSIVNKLIVKAADPKPIDDKNITIPSLDGGSGTIQLPKDASGTITLDVAGKKYTFPVVNGIANVKLPDLTNGDYGYILTYSGEGKYSSFSKTGTLTVNKQTTPTTPTDSNTPAKPVVKTTLTLKSVKVKKSAKKLVLQATLKIDGKAKKGLKVTFKFNGKKYTAKTNKKGVAKLTIKKNVLKKLKVGKKITYSATYGKVTKKVTVKVKK